MSEETFTKRLSEVIKEGGGPEKIAHKAFVTSRTMYNYLIGATTPSADKIERLANAMGVRTEWLVTGHGDKYQRAERVDHSEGEERGVLASIGVDRLALIIQTIEQSLGDVSRLTPKQKAGLLLAANRIYSMTSEGDRVQNMKDIVDSLLSVMMKNED